MCNFCVKVAKNLNLIIYLRQNEQENIRNKIEIYLNI